MNFLSVLERKKIGNQLFAGLTGYPFLVEMTDMWTHVANDETVGAFRTGNQDSPFLCTFISLRLRIEWIPPINTTTWKIR